MKRAILLAAAAAFLISPALGAQHPRNWSPPSPFTPFTPPNPVPHHGPAPSPSPAQPAAGSPQEVKNVLDSLLEVQAEFVADVNTADAWATVTLPGSNPPAPIDPIAHACYPVLSAWAAGLTPPVTPPVGPGGNGLVTDFEKLRVANIEAQSIIQGIIATGGFPIALQEACGGLIVNSVTSGGTIVGEVGAFDAMIARFIPKAVLMKHNVGALRP